MASNWASTADNYDKSFARLCAGTAHSLLTSIGAGAKPGGRLLDIGTGTGTMAIAVADRGFDVEAVDCEPTMIEVARKRHEHPGLHFTTG